METNMETLSSPTVGSRALGPDSLEKENFRIDSAGWEEKTLDDGTRVKTNPEGDVTELLEGEFAGEQHFTWEAAMRETAKAGKRMPSEDEFRKIVAAVGADADGAWTDPSVNERLGVRFSGYRNWSDGSVGNAGSIGYWWSSSPVGAYGYFANFYSGGGNLASNDYRSTGFSVRCLRN